MRSPPQPLASAFSVYPFFQFPRVPVDAGYLWVVSHAVVEETITEVQQEASGEQHAHIVQELNVVAANCHVCQAQNANTGVSSALPALSSHSDVLMDNGSEEQAMESFFPILDAKSQRLKHLLRRYPYVSKARARDCLPPLAVHGRAEPAKDDVEIFGGIQK